MAKSGRPELIITDEFIANAKELSSRGLTHDQIAMSLGCADSTLYNKESRIVELKEAIKAGRAEGVKEVANALFEKAVDGDNVAMIFYLTNRDRDNWINSQRVDSRIKQIPPTMADLSEEELEKELAEYGLK